MQNAETEDAFNKFEALVLNDEVPSEESLSLSDYDELLDNRDSDEFAEQWIEVYNAVEREAKTTNLINSYKVRIDALREYVFKRVYKRTSSSDLASYVSDDIDLVARAIILSYNQNWLNGLLIAYKQGKIPNVEIQRISGRITSLV